MHYQAISIEPIACKTCRMNWFINMLQKCSTGELVLWNGKENMNARKDQSRRNQTSESKLGAEGICNGCFF